MKVISNFVNRGTVAILSILVMLLSVTGCKKTSDEIVIRSGESLGLATVEVTKLENGVFVRSTFHDGICQPGRMASNASGNLILRSDEDSMESCVEYFNTVNREKAIMISFVQREGVRFIRVNTIMAFELVLQSDDYEFEGGEDRRRVEYGETLLRLEPFSDGPRVAAFYRNYVSLPGEDGLPFLPGEEISESELWRTPTVYKGVFNGEGKLVKFAKFQSGKTVFVQTVVYGQDCVDEVVVSDADGVVVSRKTSISGDKISYFLRPDKG